MEIDDPKIVALREKVRADFGIMIWLTLAV
jgi:hypothetical protein